ncbi:MAG: hypothetical protein WD296_08400 [Acidimicrobiia bacterium]
MERARAALGTVVEEGIEVALEAHRLLHLEREPIECRVDRAVEDQRANPVGELLGIPSPEQRAVRVPEVGQLRLAERAADPIHVPCHALGLEVREDGALGPLTCRNEPGHLGEEVFALLTVVRRPLDVEERVEIFRAVDLGAPADTARIEADDVESLLDLVGQ